LFHKALVLEFLLRATILINNPLDSIIAAVKFTKSLLSFFNYSGFKSFRMKGFRNTADCMNPGVVQVADEAFLF
jgi:hypothetical protein